MDAHTSLVTPRWQLARAIPPEGSLGAILPTRRAIARLAAVVTAVGILTMFAPVQTKAEAAGIPSELVTLECATSPCPWGPSVSAQAVVWADDLAPTSSRLGYQADKPAYLPRERAEGLTITVTGGRANVYAGLPDEPTDRRLAGLRAGQTYTVEGLQAGEVVSVHYGRAFSYAIVEGSQTPEVCADPVTCDPVTSVPSVWRCDTPGCAARDWTGAVISWPDWSAYDSNAREGNRSRTTYALTGETLSPYMGSWADGCQVEAVSGVVLIVEWQRGADEWRETFLTQGQTHTINLAGAEDGALIEGADNFAVSLQNCTPQPIGSPSLTLLAGGG